MNIIDLTMNDIEEVVITDIETDHETNFFSYTVASAYNLKAERECTEEELCYLEEKFADKFSAIALAEMERQREDWFVE